MSSKTAKKSSASFRRVRRPGGSGRVTKKDHRRAGFAARGELAALATLPDSKINTTDIPQRRDWSTAERGRFYRPVKRVVTIRLDADVVAWFKTRARKYQTAVNRVLREYMQRHP
jgi:uncharacterized protein (DUF4415 family)